MLQTALIHKRQGRVEQAIEGFKAIVTKYPTMDGSRDALAGLESIYVEQGRVGEYEAYVKSLKFVDPSTLDLDEKYYRSAEKLYFDEKCPQAIGAFGDYLNKYPNGAYALNALFYRGDCHYRAAQYDQALPDLEAVVKRNGLDFMENALYGASDILFRDKRWEGALDHFRQLEVHASTPQNALTAQVGVMRCLKELGRAEEAAAAAEKVAANSTANADLRAEAGLLVANGLLARNDTEGAYTKFKAISGSSTNAFGAEAKYYMAYVRHLQGQFRKAETEVFDLVKRYPSYDHWKARAFILLGDVYVQLNDRFQAKATLQSVIDNCQEPDLVAQAQQRLDAINASEVQQITPPPQEELLVPVPDNTNGQ
jgi:TolA-binding protein